MYQLAQMNLAQAKADLTDGIMYGFVIRLDEINALAEQSVGFIWRLKDDSGNDATSIQAFENPLILVNMSVWQNLSSLQHFTYKTVHAELIKQRKNWMERMEQMHQVLWWIPAGHTPTVHEAKERLTHLREHGASQYAFTFAKPFEPPRA